MPPMARRWAESAAGRGGGRGGVGPFVFFLMLATVVLWPLLVCRNIAQSTADDLSCHLSGIVEATRALEQGQFPLRVAPVSNDGRGYPFFAYYGNFPYTAGGVLCRFLGVNPFTAWKIVSLFALTIGGYFTYRSCGVLTRQTLPSIVGGVVFVLSPYLWVDMQVRWAYPEAIAINVLPAVLFFSLRSYATRSLLPVLMTGVAWSLLALSHNIAYLYGSLFLGLLFAIWFGLSLMRGQIRKSIRRLMRVGIGYALGVLLSLWFLVPQLYTLNYIGMGNGVGMPHGGDVLNPPHVLFAPVLTEPPGGGTPNMGVQTGWPVLAGCALAIATMLRPATPRRTRWILFGVLCLFALSVLMVAMPTRAWVWVPKMFYFVQSSYRLLMFVALFGAVLAGVGLAGVTRRRINLPATLFALLLVAVASISYVQQHGEMPAKEMDRIVSKPDLGNNGGRTNFLPSPTAASLTSVSHPEVNFAEPIYGLVEDHRWLRETPTAQTYVPRSAVRAGGRILVEGAASKEFGEAPARLRVALDGVDLPEVTLEVAPMNYRVELPLPPEPPGDGPVLLSLRADRYPIESKYAYQVHRVSFMPAVPEQRAFVPASNFKNGPMEGGRMRYRVTLDKPSLVQLPAFYYPGVMRLRVGKTETPITNLGSYVAIPLDAGQHRITVWYAGVGWANVASGVGLIATLGGIIVLSVKRGRKNFRCLRFKRHRTSTAPALVLCFVVIGGTLLSPTAARTIRKQLKDGPSFTVTASHEATEAFTAPNAFDDNPSTQWFPPTGQADATLTLDLDRPATLQKAVFESRSTTLYETWMTIRVELFLKGEKVSIQKFTLPKAAIEPTTTIGLEPVVADRIEFHFSNPVNVTRDGVTPVDVRTTSPGYREIRLTWAK